jgi:acylphosphatase
MPGETTIHLIITGRVQGVGYRAWCKATADECGLSGWVRNRRDGSVEALARGGAEDIEKFVAACRQGPTFAKVDDIARSLSAEVPPWGFEQRATL